MKICEECGKDYIPSKHRAAAQRFCGDKCSDKWWSRNTRNNAPIRNCALCGKEYPGYKSKKGSDSKYCSSECQRSVKYSRIWYCVICGKVMKKDKKHCSKDCQNGHQRICEICGVQFTGIGRAKFHSRECELENGRRCAREYDIANHEEKELICAECGKPFKPEYGDKKRVFCSGKCSRKKAGRIGKATRRARKYGAGYENIDPIAILNRDKWTCQICGIKTPKKLRGTILDNAPEVDHIISLAAGGKHVAHNLQCACRKCNYTKGDKITGQLILFAGSEICA